MIAASGSFDAANLVYLVLGSLVSASMIYAAMRSALKTSTTNVVRDELSKQLGPLEDKIDRALADTAFLQGVVGHRRGG